MASISFTAASNQLNTVRGQDHQFLPPVDNGARVRVKRFRLEADGEAADKYHELAELPGNAVLLGGRAHWTTLVANTGPIGFGYTAKNDPVDGNDGALGSGHDVSSAGSADIQPADSADATVEETSRQVLYVKSSNDDDWNSSGVITGYVIYAVNT